MLLTPLSTTRRTRLPCRLHTKNTLMSTTGPFMVCLLLRLRAASVILGLYGCIPLVSSARKYRRGRARSHCPSLLISSHIVSHLQQQRAGTSKRTFFRSAWPFPKARGARENLLS